MTEVASKGGPAQPAAGKPRANADVDYSNLRRELETIKSASGTSLFAHVEKVFEHVILHSPDRALERFEEISFMIKSGLDPNTFFKVNDIRNYKELA